MIKTLIQAAVGVLGLVTLLMIFAWVVQIGPFKRGPSAAAKLQPRVERAVEKTKTQQSAAVAKVTKEAQTSITSTSKRTQDAVADVRAAEVRWKTKVVQGPARALPYPDDAAYRGLCRSIVYARNPVCHQYGGKPAR